MSHTSTITSVVITDEQALRATITELKSNGVRCDLLENAKPRAYFTNQAGMEGEARYVIQLHDSRYDVGLYQKEGGNGYEIKADFWAGEVAKQLGAPTQEGEGHEQAHLGKLFKLYAVHAATRRAVQQGYRVNRINKSDGSVQLQIAVAA